ncbi:MAG: hypothetical protein H0T46_20610 [Deltaproteobacteria bacterium]|nr:hypothetical protein [Deltaproteobacteria bacterium]
MRSRLGIAVVVLSLVAAACGKKKSGDSNNPSPEVTGLAAVPATAQVLVAADVTKLQDSALVARAVDQLLLRDPVLASRWAEVTDTCKIDLTKQVKRVMLALGAPPATAPTGTGPVLMVAIGSIAEPDLSACIRTLVGKGGGALTVKTVGGRSLYQVKDGNRTMFFAFGRPDTVILGTSEAWVLDALGTGPKAVDSPDLKTLLPLVDQNAPVWAIGKVDERVRQGLVGASGGRLKAGPKAIVATVDPTDGAKLNLGAVMGSVDDAKGLESFANTELKLVAMVAQMKSLGSIVAKIQVQSEGTVVRFRAPLSVDDVNTLLSVLDEKPASEQVSPPPGESPGTK